MVHLQCLSGALLMLELIPHDRCLSQQMPEHATDVLPDSTQLLCKPLLILLQQVRADAAMPEVRSRDEWGTRL